MTSRCNGCGDLQQFERGDTIHVDHDDPDWPHTYEVMDTDVEDIGLAEIVVVAVVAGCDRYTVRRVGDDDPTLKHEAGAELTIDAEDIGDWDEMEQPSKGTR